MHMRVVSLHPNVRFEQVQDATGFALAKRDPLDITQPPTELELQILRNEVDPHRYVLGR